MNDLSYLSYAEYPDPDEKPEKPSKDEYTIASWLRSNVPTKKTKFFSHNVQYFTGSKAVDALMASKFGTPAKEGEEPFFTSREHCISFLDNMLRHKFFHRAKKVAISEDMLKPKKKKDSSKTDDKDKKEKESKSKDDDQAAESSHAEGKGQEQSETEDERKKKKKKKVRLEMHLQQFFADSLDAYVWIYDPIPAHYWFFGFLVVLAGIGICLFPLWPPSVRMGVYYLSMAGAGFLVFIIALAVLRSVIFFVIWVMTFGKHHFWIFPNLTEDVGVIASFWPLYEYKYIGDDVAATKKKKKKEKLSDNEEEDTRKNVKETTEETEKLLPEEAGGDVSGSESEHSSQQSQTGKDFELVDREEVENQ
ncbi:translocation protein SEC62 isoform X2 [Cimex lectularius]|uniref:Translocation protein SEC62 n=1 Tax=Cimex lectularius TaxID=79782 RepID=A0A8I6THT3_CIMLE|nr:translocation protein SEC62 isoform X2 [Cimex lectularius]